MEALNVREYRNNLASCFQKAAEGEKIIIRRKNQLFTLISLGSEDIRINDNQQKKIDALKESIKKSWDEVKKIESGELPTKSAEDFLNEL